MFPQVRNHIISLCLPRAEQWLSNVAPNAQHALSFVFLDPEITDNSLQSHKSTCCLTKTERASSAQARSKWPPWYHIIKPNPPCALEHDCTTGLSSEGGKNNLTLMEFVNPLPQKYTSLALGNMFLLLEISFKIGLCRNLTRRIKT